MPPPFLVASSCECGDSTPQWTWESSFLRFVAVATWRYSMYECTHAPDYRLFALALDPAELHCLSSLQPTPELSGANVYQPSGRGQYLLEAASYDLHSCGNFSQSKVHRSLRVTRICTMRFAKLGV